MYAADLADNIREHKVNLHGYADDTQLYIHCQPDETAAAVAVLECCIKDVDDWMSPNRLKLNMDKTELLWVGTKYNLSKLNGSLCSSSPPLSTHVNMCACLVFISRRIWVSTSTFPVSAVPAFTSFANYDASGVRLTRSLRLHSCTPSWRHASITVMQCSPRHRRRQQTSKAHQRCQEIRPRTVTIDAPEFTLAWHSWASQLQTLSTDTSMCPREGSSVLVGLLYTSIPSCCMTAPVFNCSSPSGGSPTSAQHVRPPGIRCRWPDHLQRSARWAARPHRQHDNFQTTFKDTFFLELSTCLAH